MAPPQQASMRWVTVGGRAMFARTWAANHPGAPVVVLVHGLVVSSADFVPTGQRLAGAFRVLAPDLPGFGRSGAPRKVLRVPELADELVEWLTAVELDRVAVVANSFGCQVSAELAVRRPDLVDRLVLASPTADPSARTVVAHLRRFRREAKTQSCAMKKVLLRDYARAGVRRAVGTFRVMLTDRMEDRLPYVEVPALVVRGTADPIVPRAWAEEVARLLPAGRLVVLPGAPHAMNFDAPAKLVAAIRPFLSEPVRRRSQE